MRLIRLIFGFPLIIVALLFMGKYIISQSQQIKFTAHINIALLVLGIFFFMLYFFLRAYFWREIIKEKDRNINISLRESTFLWTISEVKRFIPGNIWSFVGRIMAFSQKGIAKKTTGMLLLTESEFLIIGGIGISVFSLPFLLKIFHPKYLNAQAVYFAAILISLVFPVLFIFSKPLIPFLISSFSPKTNLRFLFVSYVYSAVFGIGMYFTASSAVYLNPAVFTQLTGFFVFAFLIGYLSIITPMGLGVREAVIIIGLTTMISLPIAGFVAIYSRIVFIVSELLLLLTALFWKHTKSRLVLKLETWISSNQHKTVLMLLVIFYILYFTAASFLRYQNYYTGRFDLGNMDQTVWNTLHGRFFQLTNPNGTNVTSRLSFHADFILILLSPLYILWQDPRMLLLLQTIVIALGAIFVFNLSDKILKDKNISLVLSIGYLLYPSLNYENLYDFHPVALATTFLLAAFYFLYCKKYTRFIIFALLAAFTKEEIWLIIGLMGLYAAQKKRLLGLIISIVSLAVFYYLIWIAIPQVKGSQHFALSYYSDFGQSPGEIVKNILLEPQKTLGIFLQKDNALYLLELFSPLAFISLFSPLFLFSLPDLALNLLSSNINLHQIYYQYTSAITPFIFISAVFGIAAIKKLIPRIHNYFFVVLLAVTISYTSYLTGPMPWSRNANLAMFTKPVANRKIIDNFISDIPKKYTIAATNNLGSHLSHRRKIFTIPVGINKADIIMFLLNDGYVQPSLKAQKETAQKMKRDKDYIEVFKDGDFIVFEKRNLYLEKEPKIRLAKLFPLSIPALSHRDYLGGEIQLAKLASSNHAFETFDTTYPSDGLTLHATIDIPNASLPANGYPVLIITHGYSNPKDYNGTLYAPDEIFFASRGFLVIKPDYRFYDKSESDKNSLSYLAYPIDVINLLTSLKNLNYANLNRVYILGDRFGASIALEVLEITGDKPELRNLIKGAIIKHPVINPLKKLEQSNNPYLVGLYNEAVKTIGQPKRYPDIWQSLEPLSYLVNIKTPILIEHDTNDETLPFQDSISLYDDLMSLNKNAKLILYANHNLRSLKAETNELGFFNEINSAL